LNQRLNVLIVDDESSQRSGLAAMVAAWGMTPETAADGNEALDKLNEFAADVILTDLNMPGLDGFGFLERLRERGDMPPTIVLTAFGNIETAVKTVHELGAYWFLEKPIQPSVLEVLIRRAGTNAELRSEKRVLERNLVYKGSLGDMVGTAPKMQEIFALLQQAGPSKACVLITGESGTGKELVARTLHALSPRRHGPFVAINCAALPETLIESELFGHEKGSFTGATERRAGCFEVAQHGTLLLDEIGEMPMPTQAKLLRILEDPKVRRLGGRTEFEVDVRVVAATNKLPEEVVSGGHLREDLFYRLNVFHIHLPPLRERKEDIPFLAEHFVKKLSRDLGAKAESITEGAIQKLVEYPWPGNVRQLENVIERSLVLASGSRLEAADIRLDTGQRAREPVAESFLADGVSLDQHEQAIIREALRRADGNKSQAARLLGLTRNALRYRLSQMGMDKEAGGGE
jgi:DNA-binding NtrC family response regulator